ncbi:NAD(P)/FAD-dependent oxidoreductase [Dinoroseobacter sp. S76]|uniref:NAD(P)/FAD-dependent oxidoreductase n=1 Tax=Dinoroseobacter sp. S76 TaxID=3415124 RepID=UPI003C7EB137
MDEILICGGGFAGVWAAMSAAATRDWEQAGGLKITLLSDRPELCVRPRLYEGAAPDMLVPLSPLMAELGVDFVLGQATKVTERAVRASSGAVFPYDRLVLATGSRAALPAIPRAAEFGFFVDTYESTARLDAHLAGLGTASAAERRVVVIGAGLTGLEVATNLRMRFGAALEILLVDRAANPGQGLGEAVEAEIATALVEANVRFLGGDAPHSLTPEVLTLGSGRVLETHTVIFATGLRASHLTAQVSAGTGANGRLVVQPDLRVADRAEVFAAGDVALAQAERGRATLMSCQHAIPTGVIAGHNAVRDLLRQSTVVYGQPDYATCIDLGPYGAVFTQGWDRALVKTREDGAEMKAEINRQWIYPPRPELGRAAIHASVLALLPQFERAA